tara:strand:+ start:197 stop:403 length:207 start_codon:yes stop_codon:yes gene_type:complete
MNVKEINPFKRVLMQKLALLLFVNSKSEKDLKESKKNIISCENYTKEKIIKLIEIEEKNTKQIINLKL